MTDDYVIAKYIRLSSEDYDNNENGKTESNSVKNQRDLLDDFISRTPELAGCEVIEFCDDGRTGTNFDRPGVGAMLEQAEKGRINCIIVKDLSRFGRNHIEVGNYLEQVFPIWGVRFISVNDMFDSNQYLGMTGGIDIAFRNLIYDIYSRDLSEKVRSARIALGKQASFVSPYAFYGYVKDKQDKRRLVIDEDAAKIVRLIFDMAENGATGAEIAKRLNSENVPTPQMRQKQLGNNRKWHMNSEANFWDGTRINLILKDERYTGKMISCKSRRLEVGKVKARKLPESEWIVVPNAFPAIITEEQYARVREIKQGPIPNKKKETGKGLIFYRKIKCGVCRKAMPRTNYRDKKIFYACETSRNISGFDCSDEKVYESSIVEAVLASVKQMAKFADRAKKQMEAKAQALQPDADMYAARIRELKIAIEKASLAKLTEYENYREGGISKDSYLKAIEKYTVVISEYERQIAELENKIREIRQERGRENIFVERFKKHTGIHRLTRAIVDELISVVYVYDSTRIEIVWNFADEYAALVEQMKQK